jgi:PAP2 superfamily
VARPLSGHAVARGVSEVFSPLLVNAVLLFVIALHRAPSLVVGLGWAAVAIAFVTLIPQAIIVLGVRRNRLSDRHVRVREQRPGLIVLALLSIVVGLSILGVLHASRELLALLVAMLVGLVVTLLVTLFWKVSLHTSTFAGAVTILVLAFGPIFALLYPLVILIGWARVELGDHRPGQVGTGVILGIVIAATVFSTLR